jgi:hypothetical protein
MHRVSPNELREISRALCNGLMDFFTDKISIVFSLIFQFLVFFCRLYYLEMLDKFSVGHEIVMICMS